VTGVQTCALPILNLPIPPTSWSFSTTNIPSSSLTPTSKIGFTDYNSTPHPVNEDDFAQKLKESRDKLKHVETPVNKTSNDLTPKLLKETRELLKKPVIILKPESNEPTFSQRLMEGYTKLKPADNPSKMSTSIFTPVKSSIVPGDSQEPDSSSDNESLVDVGSKLPMSMGYLNESFKSPKQFKGFKPFQRPNRVDCPRCHKNYAASYYHNHKCYPVDLNTESPVFSAPDTITGPDLTFTPNVARKGTSTRIVYLPSDNKSLQKLFEKGLSSLQAGNKSNEVKNQLSSILDRFVETGQISSKDRLRILKQYIEK